MKTVNCKHVMDRPRGDRTPKTRLQSLLVPLLVLSVIVFNTATPFTANAAETFDDLIVGNEPQEFVSDMYYGYVEYRIRLQNLSEENDHVVTLIAPDMPYNFRGPYLREIRRTVLVPAGTQTVVSLPQPPAPLQGNDEMMVIIDGRVQKQTVPLDIQSVSGNTGYGWSEKKDAILLSRRIAGEFINSAENALPEESTPSPHFGGFGSWTKQTDAFNIVRAELPVENWSNSWLSYSRYGAVFIAAEDFRGGGPAREALLQYVHAGGVVAIVGVFSVPPEWQSQMKSSNDYQTLYLGFGQLIFLPESNASRWSDSLWHSLQSAWHRTGIPWQTTPSLAKINDDFPVVESLGIPARGLFLIMLLFAILIGPMNFLFISKKGKRIRILWTVPLISLAACVGIFCYAILAEGWQGQARSASLTILDEPGHRAATVGMVGYYCPLTPRGGLHFERHTEVSPVLFEDDEANTALTVDWTEDQHLASGWVKPRIPAYFKIRKSEIRRERLVVQPQSNGDIKIVNGLGADIEQLTLVNPTGRLFRHARIPAGDAVLLRGDQSEPIPVQLPAEYLRSFYGSPSWATSISNLTITPEQFLEPGCYIALLDKSPFLEPGLTDLKSHPKTNVVYGRADWPSETE